MRLSDEEKKKAEDIASGMANDFAPKKAATFAERHKNKGWYRNFKLLLEMISDEDYKLSTKSWSIIAGALAYVVMPIDLVPDFIPILGWLFKKRAYLGSELSNALFITPRLYEPGGKTHRTLIQGAFERLLEYGAEADDLPDIRALVEDTHPSVRAAAQMAISAVESSK